MPKAIRIPLADWPRIDREAWNRAITAIDYFDELAPAAAWSAATRGDAQAAYGRWLAFLRDRFPNALDELPAQRLDRERGRLYVEHLANRISPMGVAAELGHLRLMLRVVAPASDWSWLRQLQARFRNRAVPRDIRHKIVHPVRLIELGKRLMDTAETMGRQGEAPRQYRDGLLIALLTARPQLRRRALQELESDVHLRRAGGNYVLVLQKRNTKTRVGVETPLPEWLTPYLTKYLEQIRPQFPRAGSESALWLSDKGGPLCADAIYRLVTRRTKAAFGEAIFPHLVRHIAATTIAREQPGAIQLASDLLTHAKIETTAHHYSQAGTHDAARKYQAALSDLHARVLRARQSPKRQGDDVL